MNKILSAAFLVIIFLNATDAKEITGANANKLISGTNRIVLGDKTGYPTFINMNAGNEISISSFEKWMKASLKTKSEFGLKLLNQTSDKLGMVHYRYQQTWNGLPVEGTMWIAHTKNGKVVSCNGFVIPDCNTLLNPTISESTALNFALSYVNAKTYQWQTPEETEIKINGLDPFATYYPKPELFFAPVNGNYGSGLKLCYRVDVYASSPLSRQYVFIDAVTGQIIYVQERIHSADAVGTAVTGYSGSQTITADTYNGGYRLLESGARDIHTRNYNGGTSAAGATEFEDADNFWDNQNAALDEYATDAHWGAELTWDYYLNTFNRSSVDDNGMQLICNIHVDAFSNFNAFWDGGSANYYDGGGSPLTCLDVVAHELTHGMTQFTSGLNYQDESGGLNESFSDIFGEILEFHNQPGGGSWLIGEHLSQTIRNMANPNQYNNPDTYHGTYWHAAGGSDNGGVHTNSGVQNYWFYLMSDGGSGTNDNGHAYNIAGLGLDSAAEITYRMETVYLTPTSQYADARNAAIQSATDLWGACSPQVQMVADAWWAVGVGTAFSPTVISDFTPDMTTSCSAPATFQFQNQSLNTSNYTWSFGDGVTSNLINPSHTYTTYGNFTVKLVSSGGCGVDSVIQTNLIHIDSLLPCIFNMPVTGSSTINSCSGLVYDNGGPSGNYNDNEDVVITLSPSNATGLTLTFTDFNYEATYDYLFIYDGPTTASPLIGQYDGTNLPNGGTITPTGNSITLRSVTDGGVTEIGFDASFQCVSALPNVNFSSDFTTTCMGDINFFDQTINSPTDWIWDFGDGATSTLQNPSHHYNANGNYTVKLIATNSIGTDSAIQTNYITVNLPSSPTTVGGSNCASGTVQLSATGSGGLINWYDTPGGNLLGTGSSFTTPNLTSTTTFYATEESQAPPMFAGAVDNTIGSASNYTAAADRFQIFDVYANVTLVSCVVFATGDGDREIQLLDASGNILKDTTENILDGNQEVFLNWDLPVANGLQLGVLQVANLSRNSTGANYPYTIPGVISITGNSVPDPARWYFLYNWKLSPPTCESAATPVVATIGNLNAAFTSNAAGNVVSFSNISTNATTYAWSFGDGATDNTQSPSHAYTTTGTFTVTLIACNSTCCDTTINTVVINADGINNVINQDGWNIYPNPSMDNFILNYSGSHNIQSLMLCNTIGQQVWNTVAVTSNNWLINAKQLAAGTYYLTVKSSSGVKVFKLEKLN